MVSPKPKLRNTKKIIDCAFDGLKDFEDGKTMVISPRIPGPRELQKVLSPHEQDEYPLRQMGSVTKISTKYWANWPQIKKIRGVFRQIPEIADEIRRTSNGEQIFDSILHQALVTDGIDGYRREWGRFTTQTVHELLKPGDVGSIPYQANTDNAQRIAKKIKGKLADPNFKGDYRLVDIGCGGGGTIQPILEKLTPEEKARLDIVIVDIREEGLESTKQVIVNQGINDKQVTAIQTNLSNINEKTELNETADLVTSGAALHHSPVLEKVYENITGILKPGGEFCGWDWTTDAWRAPNLLVAPAGLSVLESGKGYQKGKIIIPAPEDTAFISSTDFVDGLTSGLSPNSLQTTKAILSAWAGPLLRLNPGVSESFYKYFDDKAKKGVPINMEKFLESQIGQPLAKGQNHASILLWEAHPHGKEHRMAIEKLDGNTNVELEYPFLKKGWMLPGTPPGQSLTDVLLVHVGFTKAA